MLGYAYQATAASTAAAQSAEAATSSAQSAETSALSAAADLSEFNTALGGKADLVNGVIPVGQLPSSNISISASNIAVQDLELNFQSKFAVHTTPVARGTIVNDHFMDGNVGGTLTSNSASGYNYYTIDATAYRNTYLLLFNRYNYGAFGWYITDASNIILLKSSKLMGDTSSAGYVKIPATASLIYIQSILTNDRQSFYSAHKEVRLVSSIDYLDLPTSGVYKTVIPDLTLPGQYIDNPNLGGRITLITASGYNSECVAVFAGEKYYITGRDNYSSRCYVILDSNLNVLSKSSGTSTVVTPVDTYLTIKSNGWLLFGGYNNDYTCKKLYRGEQTISPLAGLKIGFDGDSIAIGTVPKDNYAKQISNITGCVIQNLSIDGATFTRYSGNLHHIVDTVLGFSSDIGMVCLEGGINDYWANATLGTISAPAYDSTLDETTFCGCVEKAIRNIYSTYPTAQIVFVLPHSILQTDYQTNNQGNTFADYRNAVKAICARYGVLVVDLKECSKFWTSNPYLAATYTVNNGDGCHPNSEGYRLFYTPPILRKLESLAPITI